jgi:hypothetical protein
MTNQTAIVSFVPRKYDWRKTYIQAMWLMFLRTPHKPAPEVDGFYSLGEIGEAPEKAWTRLTPYSIARKEPRGNHREECQRILDI